MNYKSLTRNKVLKILPDRRLDAHKSDMGKVLLLCGSEGYSGAAAMAAMGALRAGSGLVYLGVPKSIYQICAIKLNEPIVFPLADQNGMLSVVAMDKIKQLLPKMDAVLVGPGVGISEETEKIVIDVLASYKGTVILDADGIMMIKSHKHILRDRTGQTVLTPHEGEFVRFTGEAISDRKICAERLAEELGCIVLLKGHNTVITDGATTYINPTGNPGMAVGGSGDVLSGIITALIGQGIPALEATACGAWLHGAAGDTCAKKIGQYGMLPTDMINVLPRLMK